MKIIWVVRPAEGGMVQHLQQLSTGIRDLEIVIVGPSNMQEKMEGRRFIPLELSDGLNFRKDLFCARQLRQILNREEPYIIHAHGLKAALISAMALAPQGHPRFLFTAHNALPQFNSPLKRVAYHMAQRWVFQSINTIISVSDTVRSQFINLAPGKKILTIHNGISIEKFGDLSPSEARIQSGLRVDDVIIGTVARLIPSKGLTTLLEAISLLVKIVPKTQLVILGDGPERKRLERYAYGLGIGDKVHFLGFRDDVPQLMAGWDIFVLPSLTEGFNLSVLEAMASSLPVVVSDLPSLREAVVHGQGGFAVIPGSAIDMAASVLHLLKSPEKAKMMGRFNRQRVSSFFEKKHMIECTQAIYEGLME